MKLIKKVVYLLVERKYTLSTQVGVSVAIKKLGYKNRFILSLLIIVFIISAFILVLTVSNKHRIVVPSHGGTLTEGIIGSPRFINPILANSNADRDLTMLVYSGLMRVSVDGILMPDLAKSYSISDDGLIYTFTLKDNLVWHDKTPITAKDIVFTVSLAQNTELRSPRRANWDGVIVEKIDDKTIQFVLNKPYAPFLENTVLGILPYHLWNKVTTEQFALSKLNTNPIGSGPYKVSRIKKDDGGIPISYTLRPFKYFALGEPNLRRIKLLFYPNEEQLIQAFEKGDIVSMGSVSPVSGKTLVEKGYRVESSALPRIFGLFFNQNNADIFASDKIRKALNLSVDKQKIINEVLYGYGTMIDGPIPPGSIGYTPPKTFVSTKKEQLVLAGELLDESGWKLNDETKIRTNSDGENLGFTVSTSIVPELKKTAKLLQYMWREIGILVEVEVFEHENLNQSVIRPREYDALLFGKIIGRDSDPFAFWHSSQRLDPGLNISLYTNIAVDTILEEARKTTEVDARIVKYESFAEQIANDIPAIFLYAPSFIYVLPKNINVFGIDAISAPYERFANIHKWYMDTNSVWKFFTR